MTDPVMGGRTYEQLEIAARKYGFTFETRNVMSHINIELKGNGKCITVWMKSDGRIYRTYVTSISHQVDRATPIRGGAQAIINSMKILREATL
jgi:hypothetical protein